MADQEMVGKIGRMTGEASHDRLGEVMIPVRGGVEAFNAYSSDPEKRLTRGMRVVVIEYLPPRTVVVAPM
ncbi:MAG TPA: hypothetical protein VK009_23630 [Chloroflexota bacterium]|nr:hypothetical protein [Chloroflexota bacterium]